jgi:hypothetical protein
MISEFSYLFKNRKHNLSHMIKNVNNISSQSSV